MEILSIYDILLTPIYVLLIMFLAYYYQKSQEINHPEYKYFTKGLLIKMIGALALGLFYNFYYNGGDTNNYFQTARAYGNLLGHNNENFISGWLGNPGINANLFFNEKTGFPMYKPRDATAFFVARLEVPIVLISCKTYFPAAIVTATIGYTGIWKLFRVFYSIFPQLMREFAIAILFIPSVVFWGSGIMKDVFTMSAVGWYTFSFYFFFIQKKFNPKYMVYLFVSCFVLVSIKPYILFALLPGSIIWLANNFISKIRNKILRFLLGPAFLVSAGVGSFIILGSLGDYLGKYKVEKVLETAVSSQRDMKAAYYKGNSFDIGEFDGSASSASSKAPIAIFSGLYRPSILDVKNPLMLLSAIENSFFLFLSIYLIIKLRLKGLFKAIGSNPIVLFSILFAIFFAFSIGLSVSNFGTMVRLRIPAIPFFISSLYILM